MSFIIHPVDYAKENSSFIAQLAVRPALTTYLAAKTAEAAARAVIQLSIGFTCFLGLTLSRRTAAYLPFSLYTTELKKMVLFFSLTLYALYSPLRAAHAHPETIAKYRTKLERFEKIFSTTFEIDSIEANVKQGQVKVKLAKKAFTAGDFLLVSQLLDQIETLKNEILQIVEKELAEAEADSEDSAENSEFDDLARRALGLNLEAIDQQLIGRSAGAAKMAKAQLNEETDPDRQAALDAERNRLRVATLRGSLRVIGGGADLPPRT